MASWMSRNRKSSKVEPVDFENPSTENGNFRTAEAQAVVKGQLEDHRSPSQTKPNNDGSQSKENGKSGDQGKTPSLSSSNSKKSLVDWLGVGWFGVKDEEDEDQELGGKKQADKSQTKKLQAEDSKKDMDKDLCVKEPRTNAPKSASGATAEVATPDASGISQVALGAAHSDDLDTERNRTETEDSGPTAGEKDVDEDREFLPVLVHGTVEIIVHEARNMCSSDPTARHAKECLNWCDFHWKAILACKSAAMLETGTCGNKQMVVAGDPFVAIHLGGVRIARSQIIRSSRSPVWEEHFIIPVAHNAGSLDFSVHDEGSLGELALGKARVKAEKIVKGEGFTEWLDLLGPTGKVLNAESQIKVTVKFTPAVKEERFGQGVGVSDFKGVQNAYFPMRGGNRVTMYQDTHMALDFKPTIELEGGNFYEPRRCWEDIFISLKEAKHVIYIAGWSIWDKTTLLRDSSRPELEDEGLTIGELLKKKASGGVRVLVLLWDEPSSLNACTVHTDGFMGTHDEETRRFFMGSKVHCLVTPRKGNFSTPWFSQPVSSLYYSHHQKFIVTDVTPSDDGVRRPLVAYLGGIDLTDGRYDTQQHSLFRTLNTIHKVDVQSPNAKTFTSCGGPRQPWHDVHAKLEGPAVWDVVTNFEQRWARASRWAPLHHIDFKHLYTSRDVLHPGLSLNDNFDSPLAVSKEMDPETWNVQVFRSIDSGSVQGFPKKPFDVYIQHLEMDKDVAVERSIQEAYIRAIRRAQSFIYIENQYFIGSSYAWEDYKSTGANQLIPMEIALKIASKIRDGERFAAYVVLPMWPDGEPGAAFAQAILFWQSQTIKMMYRVISDALVEMGYNGAHPRDYLSFFCLGNRERRLPGEVPPEFPPAPDTPEGRVFAARRQMIYVHSKLLVVDDEYVIVGSANINQRAMDGERDTEIAMGAFQPSQTFAHKKRHPKGQVYGYRMALWAEHLGDHEGRLAPAFSNPASLECMRKVNASAEARWEDYVGEEVKDLHGHLLPYPITVNKDGSVDPLEGFEEFPDVGGSVMGKLQHTLPNDLTI